MTACSHYECYRCEYSFGNIYLTHLIKLPSNVIFKSFLKHLSSPISEPRVHISTDQSGFFYVSIVDAHRNALCVLLYNDEMLFSFMKALIENFYIYTNPINQIEKLFRCPKHIVIRISVSSTIDGNIVSRILKLGYVFKLSRYIF